MNLMSLILFFVVYKPYYEVFKLFYFNYKWWNRLENHLLGQGRNLVAFFRITREMIYLILELKKETRLLRYCKNDVYNLERQKWCFLHSLLLRPCATNSLTAWSLTRYCRPFLVLAHSFLVLAHEKSLFGIEFHLHLFRWHSAQNMLES